MIIARADRVESAGTALYGRKGGQKIGVIVAVVISLIIVISEVKWKS